MIDARLILGVDRDASAEDVRKAYLRLARLMHPDVNKAEGATEMMRVVNLAYEAVGRPGEPPKPTVQAAPKPSRRAEQQTPPVGCHACDFVAGGYNKWRGWRFGDLAKHHPWALHWLSDGKAWEDEAREAFEHVGRH